MPESLNLLIIAETVVLVKPESYPMQDEPERKSHAANILSNNLSLSNCTFLAISLSVYLFAILSNISRV